MKRIWRSLNEVSLIGLKAVLDSKSPLLRRIIWITILLTCFSLMLAQCIDRINRYLLEPVRERVRVTANRTLEYPAVTVCPINGRFPSVIPDNIYHLLGPENYNYTCWFGRGIRCDKRGNWSVANTVLGSCFTFTLNESTVSEAGTFHNLFFRVFMPNHQNNTEKAILLHVHQRDLSPALTVFSNGIVIGVGWSREIKIELRKFHLLNTRKLPCSSAKTYFEDQCRISCLSKHIYGLIKCRLPFMVLEYNVAQNCSTQSYEFGMKITTDLLSSGKWNANCSCPRSCQQTTYLTYPETTQFLTNQLKTRIYFETMVFEQVTQELAYTLISLLCDLGSTLGLLMGASLLTVCEIIEVILSRIVLMKMNYFKRQSIPSPIAVKPKF